MNRDRNPYLQNLNRIEFVVTLACSGRCKHCSEGEHASAGDHIAGDAAAKAVRSISEDYLVESLMTFGGEPLLYPETVYSIHVAARDVGIPCRQLITNGFFSRKKETIRSVAQKLIESGVNDICLSADAFHQETIPLEPVKTFAEALLEAEVPKLRVHPAWLVSETADNPYNKKTRDILAEFQAMGIAVSDGNVIFPGGNALKYLRDYFDLDNPPVNPYIEDPKDMRAISIKPNGDVLGGNIHRMDIREILAGYEPSEKASLYNI